MALRQTKGRGRFGREWVSPLGGLYVSLALDVSDIAERIAPLSLLVALAVRKELSGLVKRETLAKDQAQSEQHIIQLKWPNDIVCSQGKLVGILIELLRSAPNELNPKQQHALIGVGININRPADAAIETAAYLADFSDELPSLEQLAIQVVSGIIDYYNRWKEANCEFARFADEYNESIALANQVVVVSNSEGGILAKGAVQGVNSDGLLQLLDKEGHLIEINTGEVTLRQ